MRSIFIYDRKDRKDEPDIKSIPVVDEYPDVFPEELSGLIPDRVIDFAIELATGNALVSKAPYRMAPAKLKELMVQIEKSFG